MMDRRSFVCSVAILVAVPQIALVLPNSMFN